MRNMDDMADEDIIGFGDPDRTPRAPRLNWLIPRLDGSRLARLRLRLDRLALRVTRRPRLAAATAVLMVAALAAGGFFLTGATHAAARQRAESSQCVYGSQSKAAAAIAAFFNQIKAQNKASGPVHDSSITFTGSSMSFASGQLSFAIDPSSGKITCSRHR